MFEFHYTKMKPNLEIELLYSDTDSFIYAVKTEEIYEDFKFFQSDFDFSNYPSDHPLYSEENKKVVLKMKDEMGGNFYGGIMENYPLPLKDEKLLPQILMTSQDSQLGYVVKCDREIPEDLHGYFQDFSIAPTKEIVTMDMLSTDQIKKLARLNAKTLPKVPKLMQTLNPKHKYVLHYLTLIL